MAKDTQSRLSRSFSRRYSKSLLQAIDWGKDIRRHGLGSDGVLTLMFKPYRRIVVLHVAILASGFLLAALNSPVAGLLMLVAFWIA